MGIQTKAPSLLGLIFCLFHFALPLASQPNSSLLWEISGNGLKTPSYLFGTIHLICQDDFLPGDSLANALSVSQHLLLELDMTDPNLTASLMKSMFMKDGIRFSDLVSTAQYARVKTFFRDSLEFDIELMAGTKPFLLSSIIFSKILNCPAESFEGRLTEIAQKQGISVGGLETPEEQAAIFDSIPYQKQADLIVNLIDSIGIAKEHFTHTVSVYKSQDIEKIYAATSQSDFDFGGFEKIMLSGRNRKWIPMIEESARQKSTFVAVGAAHLGSPDGIVSLLRQLGYTLRPIPN